MLYSGLESERKKHMKGERAILNCGGVQAASRLSEAERNPLTKRASSATLDAQSTATELGRDPNMRRNVPMGALLPRSRKREKKSRPSKNTKPGKKSIFYIF